MKKNIELCGKDISYTLKVHKRTRNMKLSISGNGLVVTVPPRISLSTIREYILKKESWIITTIDRVSRDMKSLGIKNTKSDFKKNKERARERVSKALITYNQIYGFNYNQISIRNQKTRWGSCSKKGNLNFNYRIALLPEHLADYIVVHELCHLKEFNHAQGFWDLVAVTVPDYKDRRKELKKYRLS